MFRNSVFLQKQWFFEIKHEFLKIAKSNSFAVEWDWKIEKAQNFQNFCSLKENTCIFWKKKLKLFKNFKGIKIAVECDWNSQICQNVQHTVLS